jgi:hypothetical protein
VTPEYTSKTSEAGGARVMKSRALQPEGAFPDAGARHAK